MTLKWARRSMMAAALLSGGHIVIVKINSEDGANNQNQRLQKNVPPNKATELEFELCLMKVTRVKPSVLSDATHPR